MLGTYTKGERLRFNFDLFIVQKMKYIPCGVTGCKNNSIAFKDISIGSFSGMIFSFLIVRSITFLSNQNSPPASTICFLIAVMICGSLLVPIWGCDS